MLGNFSSDRLSAFGAIELLIICEGGLFNFTTSWLALVLIGCCGVIIDGATLLCVMTLTLSGNFSWATSLVASVS